MSLRDLYINNNDSVQESPSDLKNIYHGKTVSYSGLQNTESGLSSLYGLPSYNISEENRFVSYDDKNIKKPKKSKYVYPHYAKK